MIKKASQVHKHENSFFDNFLSKNVLKLISLLIAFLLWQYILNGQAIEFESEIKINYILPEKIVFKDLPPELIKVKLLGPRRLLKKIEVDQELVVNLNRPGQKGSKGNVLWPISLNEINYPYGVKIISVEPSELDLDLDNMASQKFSITPVFINEMPENTMLDNWKINRPTVTLEGPRDILKAIKNIPTKPIDRQLLVASGEIKIQLDLPDSRFKVKESGDLLLNYGVKSVSENVVFDQMKIRFITSRPSFSPETRFVTLVLKVPQQYNLQDLKKMIRVVADIPEESSGVTTVKLEAKVPENVQVIQVKPSNVRVKIK